MLAGRESLQKITELVGNNFYIEEKLDGERIQLHKKGREYRYWSRKGKEYTYLYDKSLSPYITSCFSNEVDSIILDGEMVAYDTIKEVFEPFGSLKTAALGKNFLFSFFFFFFFFFIYIYFYYF